MPECERLDEYLNGELDDHEAPRFLAHLDACAPCRATIDEQQWLDDRLRRAATAEAVPAEVIANIDRAIVRISRRRIAACGLAALTAAASLLIAVNFQRPSQKTRDAHLTTRESKPVATFVGSDDMIVVQHESPYPNVTIVEVYPTIDAVRRWRHEAEEQAAPTPQHLFGDPS